MKKLSAILLALAVMCCLLAFTASAEELPQLPSPTNLEWDYDHDRGMAIPGTISWMGIGMSNVYYEVDIYRDGEEEGGYRVYDFENTEPVWFSCEGLAGESYYESGTYTFTVTAFPYDYGTYGKSEPAQSAEWVYVKPEKTLDVCTNVSLDAQNMYWTAPADTSLVGGYEYQIFYSRFEEMNPTSGSVEKTVYSAEEAVNGVVSWDGPGSVGGYGIPGFYKLWVRMLSSDIRQANHSEWVSMPVPFCYEFDGVGDWTTPLIGRATITEVTENWVSWELPADTTYVDGYEMEIYFSEDPEATGRRLYYVGRVEGEGLATGCAWDPSAYEAFEAGYFQDGGYYRIMVMLTTNNWSEAHDSLWSALSEPYFYRYGDDGAEEAIPGDMDGDGVLDDKDVAQLLWHTLFPDAFEIAGDADFTGDGQVDDADVAYLLWHTLFPDAYPL